MGQTVEELNYDDIDTLPIAVSYGDVVDIIFEPEAGEDISDANFRMVVAADYSSKQTKTYSIANGNVTKDVDKYVVNFDTLDAIKNHKELVFDVFGHTAEPKRRLANGTITIKDSFA